MENGGKMTRSQFIQSKNKLTNQIKLPKGVFMHNDSAEFFSKDFQFSLEVVPIHKPDKKSRGWVSV